MLTFFLHTDILETHRTLFNVIIQVLFMSFQCKTPVDFLFNFGCVHVQFEISCGVEFTIWSLFVYCELNKLVQAIVFGYVTPDVQVSDSIFFVIGLWFPTCVYVITSVVKTYYYITRKKMLNIRLESNKHIHINFWAL